MITDLSVRVTRFTGEEAGMNEKMATMGHLGTHFDVMNKQFPLEYTRLRGVVFDVRKCGSQEAGIGDVALDKVEKGMFVAFCTGREAECGYGTKAYFDSHPQLSTALIDALLERGAAIIGIDCPGIRRGAEHTPTDQRCADHGAFVVENLCRLESLLKGQANATFTANTYPVNFEGMTGLPCRVTAEEV